MERPSQLHFHIQQETAPESGIFTNQTVWVFTRAENGELHVRSTTDLPFGEVGSCVALVPATGTDEDASERIKKVFDELAENQQLRAFTPPIRSIVELPADSPIASASDPTIDASDDLFPLILQQQNAYSDFDPYAASVASPAFLQASHEQVTMRSGSMKGKMLVNTPVGENAIFNYPLGKTAENRTVRISLQNARSKPPHEIQPPLPRA